MDINAHYCSLIRAFTGHKHRVLFVFSYVLRFSSLPGAQSLTFVEIDDEIILTVVLLPSAESFKKDCCQLQAKV